MQWPDQPIRIRTASRHEAGLGVKHIEAMSLIIHTVADLAPKTANLDQRFTGAMIRIGVVQAGDLQFSSSTDPWMGIQ